MSGGGGGGIIIHPTISVLRNPIVHGQLPAYIPAHPHFTRDALDVTLARPEDQWDAADKDIAGRFYHWALCNLK